MPSVFTIEGLSAAQLAQLGGSDQHVPAVRVPPYGSPLAPHGAYNVGSTRPPTLVFNAARLAAASPRVRWPDRGPITDYGRQYAPLLMMRPYVNLGDAGADGSFGGRHTAVVAVGAVALMIASAWGGIALGNYVDRSRGRRRRGG